MPMSTTAGPSRYPRYTVFDPDTNHMIGRVHRDPSNPYRWIASYRDGTRVYDLDHTTRKDAVADLIDKHRRNVL